MRIAIIGNSGSGKSTLARMLSSGSGTPVLDLDTLVWEPNQNPSHQSWRSVDLRWARDVSDVSAKEVPAETPAVSTRISAKWR